MATALVTGATAGLGRAFVERLTRDGHDVVLVARDEARMEQQAADLRATRGVDVEVLAADLGDLEACRRVEARLADLDRPVDLLVNNAGYSLNAPFLANDVEVEQQFLDVMVRAVMRLTHAAAGAMAGRGRGGIINVSSVAGFSARGTYSAHKAWVTTFSQAIAQQLAGDGVQVMALCPGYVHTEFHDRAGIDVTQLPEVLWLDADDVVDVAFRDLRRGRDVSVPDARYKTLVALGRHLPLRVAGALSSRAGQIGRR